MKLGIRGRLFLACFGVIFLVELSSGAYLARELRRWHETRVEEEMWRSVELARHTLSVAKLSEEHTIEALTRQLGKALDARLTIITHSGKVLGDSSMDAQELRSLDLHHGRPEFQQAVNLGRGSSRRYSSSVGRDMLYVALPYQRDGKSAGVVRLAVALADVNILSQNLRILVVLAGLLGLSMALVLSWTVSLIFSRTLRGLVHSTRVAAGMNANPDLGGEEGQDEWGVLTSSVRHMSSELEHVVAALATERNRLEAVLEAMDDAVIATDEHGRITLVNESGRLMVGRGNSPVGEVLVQVFDVPALNELVTHALQGHRGATELRMGESNERHIAARATPVGSGGALVMLQDITRLRHLETVRRDFVANASHELRTPVSIIQANAETLLDGALEDPVRARVFLEATARNAERLSRLIADLLDLSRIESGQYNLHPTPLSVREAVAQAMGAVAQTAGRKNITLESDVTDDCGVVADSKALDQILVNLLDNAIKYTSEGGRVWVDARPDAKQVRIDVRDNGPGVDPLHRDRLFERFYRVDTGRSRAMGGTGLGLAIVKHLTSCMNGHVGMEPNQATGSCFWVKLPKAEQA